ncbi:hypothetical protein DEU56DRAFT_976180 [Suillus clintonianus]|uniref:uncharacterized protein n=1 Tax=Suillus clintonianus TaxID=1904413 RepID=UPI001B8863F7|nr:uncharacterized protein DEU56DRAFT_976180 [Suillus clintonianus]KAG2155603.1 hypothetical protein DEU56DRAFT_976180 [Suillus clintonianus]
MSFNTAAQYGYPSVMPPPYPGCYELLPPRRPRTSTVTQDTSTQWHHDAQRMPGLHATNNFQPPAPSRDYSCVRNHTEVQNDWAMAAREQELACQLQVERSSNYQQHARERKERKRVSFDTGREHRASVDRKHARHESVDRERRCRASLDRHRENPTFLDYERECRPSVDRERQQSIDRERELRAFIDRERYFRESVDRERERRASIDRRHGLCVSVDRERHTSIGRHHKYQSVSKTFPRPPVCAVSFKPPTTGPQCRRTRRSSFDYATARDYSGERHPVYVLPPPALAPQVHLPPRQRDRTSMEAVRRLPFPSTEVPQVERSTESLGLSRFNPFNRVRFASMSTSQKKPSMLELPKVYSNRLRRKTAGRA